MEYVWESFKRQVIFGVQPKGKTQSQGPEKQTLETRGEGTQLRFTARTRQSQDPNFNSVKESPTVVWFTKANSSFPTDISPTRCSLVSESWSPTTQCLISGIFCSKSHSLLQVVLNLNVAFTGGGPKTWLTEACSGGIPGWFESEAWKGAMSLLLPRCLKDPS